jgi:hypothetical protein
VVALLDFNQRERPSDLPLPPDRAFSPTNHAGSHFGNLVALALVE